MRRPGLILATCLAWPMLSADVRAQSRPASQPAAGNATATRPAWPNVPVAFARSGKDRRVSLPERFNRPHEQAVLRAFGRAWTEPVPVGRNAAGEIEIVFSVPAIRVPMVFNITPPDAPEFVFGQLVAYPDRDLAWDKKITLHYCGEASWFEQWIAAAGLPVKPVAPAELAAARLAPAEEKGSSLLILALAHGEEAGNREAPRSLPQDLPALARLADEKKTNVLVLDAHWFGDAIGPTEVKPAQMHDGLAEIAKQHWPQAMVFPRHREPWGGIANRWAWIMDVAGLPLVEQIGLFSDSGIERAQAGGKEIRPAQAVILSYLPWEAQLGRDESADAVLLALLESAAKVQPKQIQGLPLTFIYPQTKPGSSLDPKQRPVLTAAPSVEPVPQEGRNSDYDSPMCVVLDLRGPDSPERAAELSSQCKHSLERQPLVRLLILGDDKLLDEWEWLKLDHQKKRVGRPGVQWLPDDELPPSKDSQVKLMLKLSELGVLLTPPRQQEKQR